jgi:hypothetical protein
VKLKALLVLLFAAGCGDVDGRLRFYSSQATLASWSFVIDDRARGAEILVDGRFRATGCNRAGRTVRCELRGLFPGGHTVEVHLPAAVLKRSVLVGKAWPERPAFVMVRDAEEAIAAAKAGADGVVIDEKALEPQEIVDAAHKHNTRALVGKPELIELAAADGLIGAAVPPDVARRFPQARSFLVDETASQAVATFAAGGDAAALKEALAKAAGIVRASGLLSAAAAFTSQKGALLDKAALGILDGRKRHKSLREGKLQDEKLDGPRYSATFVAGSDATTLLINAGGEPWRVEPALPISPLDLLGTPLEGNAITVKPKDVALLVRLPEKDKTRY